MAEALYRLGKAAAHRAWLVIGAWVTVLALAAGAYLAWAGTLTTSFDIPGLPSSDVVSELEDALPALAGASGTIVYRTQDGSSLTEDQRAAISALVADAADLPDVAQVVDPFEAEAGREAQAAELEAGRAQIEAGQVQLDAGQAQLDAAAPQVEAGQAQLDAGRQQLEAARQQAEAAGFPTAEVDAQLAALDAQQGELDAQRAQLEAAQAQLDAGREELEANAERVEEGAELMTLAQDVRVVSEDGATAVVNVAFTDSRMELQDESKQAVVEHFTSAPVDGVEVAASSEIAQGVPKLVGLGEVAGLLVAAVVLLVMLGTVLGAGIPIVSALTGVGIGALGALSLSGVVQMASVTPVLGLMLGLAVGVDYSLFILNRHRKQVLRGVELDESIGLANGTSGTAVLFAGSTVVVALLALNITGIPFLGLMGTVGAVCVAIAVLIAVTLTPALLGLVGERILSRRARAASATQDDVVAHAAPMSTRRAVVTVLLSTAVLLALAVPSLSMRVGLPDGSSEPEGSLAQRAYAITQDAFGAGANGRLIVAADLPAGLDEGALVDAQLTVARALADTDGVRAVAPVAVSDDGRLAAFQVVPEAGPDSESTEELVRALRTMPPVDGEITLGVAGQAAINIDISESLDDVLPLYLLVVVGLSLVILVLVFRSILVPLIATGGFVLSLFATYGAITAVFQEGFGAGLIGLDNPGPILSFLPIILVGILFGLAMDYQLFLATGMREVYVHGAPARVAVARGFRAGRSVVTAAGLIMVSVFGGFVFADSVMIRSVGFGLAFGVLVDAFVVRMLLMPALMHLLGDSAWWLPRWLDRLLPDVDVEGAGIERRHHLHF
ncbi:MMPL family transporter [Actinotalea subterranea]|uniref:MMPL family transporter n=1 Tax=Actinotalea subterranea TaxID=2607497 RepID=UPI0011ED90A1|nr:MMPL family transporter [Actinotalea subterranea]